MDSQKRHALCKEKSKGRAAFACSSSQALDCYRIGMESKKVAIDHFAEVARRYCAWAEDELGDPNKEMRRGSDAMTLMRLKRC
jgi:hypothetical protein